MSNIYKGMQMKCNEKKKFTFNLHCAIIRKDVIF